MIKKHPNSEKRGFTYQTLVWEEFLINNLIRKGIKKSTVLITISFPKTDKDLETGF